MEEVRPEQPRVRATRERSSARAGAAAKRTRSGAKKAQGRTERGGAKQRRYAAPSGLPDDMPAAALDGEIALGKALAQLELAGSNREAQRLVQQGAVSVDGDKATDPFAVLSPRARPYLLKVGKRRFLNLTVS